MTLFLSSIMSLFLNTFPYEFHRMTFLPPLTFRFHFLSERNENTKWPICNRNPILANDLPDFTTKQK